KVPLCGAGAGGRGGSFGRGNTRGTASSPLRIIGQSFSHPTGSRNVSRPMFVMFRSYGRHARNTAHQSPARVCTRSAWPVHVIGSRRVLGRCRCVWVGCLHVSFV